MNELHELLREIWSNRRRLLPVVVGLCFGTLGLSVLLAFGDGFDTAMNGALQRSGETMIRWFGGVSSRPFRGQPAGRSTPLLLDDLELVRKAPGVIAASIEYGLDARVVADDGQRSANPYVAAVGHEWLTVRRRGVLPGGRFLSPLDEQERRRVVVVGADLAQQLFRRADVVGRTVRVFDQPFTIVGVLGRTTALMQNNGDDSGKLFVPFATVAPLRGLRHPQVVMTRIDDAALARERERQQRALLAGRLQCDPGDRAALRVSNHALTAREIRATVTGTRLFLLVIGVLGLLVAAVGVANMTVVLVEERILEIGLRMAFGATPQQIRRRQLAETLAMVGIGGGLGLLGAAVLLWGCNQLPLDPVAKGYLGDPLLSVRTSLWIAGLLGLCGGVAGWHPAARAAAVQPVEALRHD
jgi:putative ABC transport system permease protein